MRASNRSTCCRCSMGVASHSRPGRGDWNRVSCVAGCDGLAVRDMRTSRSDHFEVLSLRHNAGLGLVDGLQQNLQFTKRVSVDHRRRGHRHDATRRGVEHPQRDLNRPRIEVRRQTTANDGAARPLALPRLMHPDLPIEPGVPAVPKDSRLGTMCVSLLGSITNGAATRRSGRSVRRRTNGARAKRVWTPWKTAKDAVCVQRRLARSVGDRPTEAKVRRLVAWIAGRREIEFLKPIDKAIQGMVSESSGRNEP